MRDYIDANLTLQRYEKLLGSDNINKVVKVLQAQSAWAQIKGRQECPADDVSRLRNYLDDQRSKREKRGKSKRISKAEVDELKEAQHRLQLDAQLMTSICGLTKVKM